MKRFKLGVFGQLITSYIVFAALCIISLTLCLVFSMFGITGGDVDSIDPYKVVDNNGQIINMSTLENLGGWVEKLDKDYKVIKVYGNKKDSNTLYTQSEIYEYLNLRGIDSGKTSTKKYRGFIKEIKEKDTIHYYLIKVDRDAFRIEYKIYMTNKNSLFNWYGSVSLLFLILFIINCIILSLFLSRKIKKPLKAITKGMEKVRSGEESVRLDFKAQVEFEEIKDTFNIMMDKLEREKEEKYENERDKKKILLDLSHDIKTPVATIKSYANALEAGLVAEEKKDIYYKIIEKKALRVSRLIDDMFTMLKLESTDYILNKQPEDIYEVLREILVEDYEEVINSGLTLNVNISEGRFIKDIDKILFQRVISNLISNSIKYNTSGELLWVNAKEDEENKIIIDIMQDSKISDEEIKSNLFNPFVRGDKARRTEGGTGLGLAISKAIIEKHGGSIEYIENGEKSLFRVIM